MNLRELQVWVEGFSNGIAPGRPPSAEQFQKMLQVIAAAKIKPKQQPLDSGPNGEKQLAFSSDKVATHDVSSVEKVASWPDSKPINYPTPRPKLSEGRLGKSGSTPCK